HSSFVHVFAELGFTGGFCFVGLFYWYFLCLKRRMPPLRPDALSQLSVSEPAEESPRTSRTSVSPEWFTRTLVPDVVVSGIGVSVCAFFLSRQYNIVLGVLLAIGATTGAIYRQHYPGAVLRITVTDLLGIAALSVSVLATVSMLVRIL